MPTPTKPEFDAKRAASRVRMIRVGKRLQIWQVAKASGLRERTIRRYEAREVENPRIREVLALAAALGVSVEELAEREWRPRPRPDVDGA